MSDDTTESGRWPAAILDSEDLHRLIIEHTRDVIRVLDTDFNFVYLSPSHEEVLGYSMDELLRTSVLSILHPDDRELAVAMHREMISKNISRDGLWRFKRKDGNWITLETRGKSLVKDGKIVGIVTIGRDVTERLQMEKELLEYQERLRFLAFHDSLTGLPNRALFDEQASQAIDTARHDGHQAALLFIDCDDFKTVNDALGHGGGDEAIKELGRRLSSAVRHQGSVARVGGDEFTILLPVIHSRHEADIVVGQVLQLTQGDWDINGEKLALTVSIGVAIYPTDGADVRSLIRHADQALYDAKKQGKNQSVFFGDTQKT